MLPPFTPLLVMESAENGGATHGLTQEIQAFAAQGSADRGPHV